MPFLTKDELASLLPHAGAMRLLDCVETWDASTIRCGAVSHRDPANPLRRGAMLDVVSGLDYAAQAMGVHVGLLDGRLSAGGSIGYVGGLRDVTFGTDRLDNCPGELTIDATRLFADHRSFMYRFAVSCRDQTVLTGRASIFLTQASG
ncbi:MAG TPA: 3-hydroxylacyl-ACP dehydratase [Phycisphaerae bacterium]|nr:3-hydroxylacyl-ACP dehydratase [Phycisphaerae bacterium]